jgi:RNA 2',3'-cyclic 3'-phosphodiesterase
MPTSRSRRKFGATQKDRIFFACLPDAVTATRIHTLAKEQKQLHKFYGTLILPEHLHVTLFHLGDWIKLPVEIVAHAVDAATQVEVQSFDTAFGRLESFRNRTGIYPFVLTGAAEVWRPLRMALGVALKQGCLGGAVHETDDFKPHITLLRDEQRTRRIDIEPIGWRVHDFVLIHSMLGKTTHIHLGRWPLHDAR